jgi:hypothetical protein
LLIFICIAAAQNSAKVRVAYTQYTISDKKVVGGILHLRYKSEKSAKKYHLKSTETVNVFKVEHFTLF